MHIDLIRPRSVHLYQKKPGPSREKLPLKTWQTYFPRKCLQQAGTHPQSRQSSKLFLQSSELALPPTPHPQCAPSKFCREGQTRWRERGWESPNSDEGPHTVVLFIYVYFVDSPKNVFIFSTGETFLQ
jgi:hypothetical protein